MLQKQFFYVFLRISLKVSQSDGKKWYFASENQILKNSNEKISFNRTRQQKLILLIFFESLIDNHGPPINCL